MKVGNGFEMNKFSHITTWIFDMDETLYPVGVGYLEDIVERFPHHVVKHYDMTLVQFHARVDILKKEVHDPMAALKQELDFKQHLWDEDCRINNRYDLLPYCEKSDKLIEKLVGRKILFTNASEDQVNAVMPYLKLGHHFDHTCANDKRGMRPKPMPEVYHELVERLGVNPQECAMIEDGAKNLIPAHEMGMTTVLVNRPENPNVDYVHHHYASLLEFLEEATK